MTRLIDAGRNDAPSAAERIRSRHLPPWPSFRPAAAGQRTNQPELPASRLPARARLQIIKCDPADRVRLTTHSLRRPPTHKRIVLRFVCNGALKGKDGTSTSTSAPLPPSSALSFRPNSPLLCSVPSSSSPSPYRMSNDTHRELPTKSRFPADPAAAGRFRCSVSWERLART